jgi:2,3,4,5-tetrahydropyridine-2-carboxylate N-succinyltransferase
MKLTDPYEIAAYIKQATKVTPITLTLQGDFSEDDFKGLESFGTNNFRIVYANVDVVDQLLKDLGAKVSRSHVEYDRRNSAIPLLDTRYVEARIEPGSFIREHVVIEKSAVIMMGAVINIGAYIGEGTMIDMGAIVGARGTIGKFCHIGAGAVVAGVLEPPSKQPVIVEDHVLVGANAVLLEGVRIGHHAVVAAGAIVTSDVEPYAVVAGSPAKFIKWSDEKTKAKTEILQDLR